MAARGWILPGVGGPDAGTSARRTFFYVMSPFLSARERPFPLAVAGMAWGHVITLVLGVRVGWKVDHIIHRYRERGVPRERGT